MRVVVDTNILVSFFRQNPVNKIISNPGFFKIQLFSPEYVFEELKKNKNNILKYSRLSSGKFDEKISDLKNFVKAIPKNLFKEFEKEAKKIAPHEKDLPIFALALKLECPIWSNELSFKEQDKIKVFSAFDMIELLF